MAKLSRTRQFFIAKDLDRPNAPGELVAIYWDEWESAKAVLEGWRGPEVESEDFARTRLTPFSCTNLLVDIGGYWECFEGTVIY